MIRGGRNDFGQGWLVGGDRPWISQGLDPARKRIDLLLTLPNSELKQMALKQKGKEIEAA